MYSCGHWISLYSEYRVLVKADRLYFLEGIRPEHVKESDQCHHRGLRPDHVFMGVTRELGRSNCLLVQIRLGVPYPKLQALESEAPPLK